MLTRLAKNFSDVLDIKSLTSELQINQDNFYYDVGNHLSTKNIKILYIEKKEFCFVFINVITFGVLYIVAKKKKERKET